MSDEAESKIGVKVIVSALAVILSMATFGVGLVTSINSAQNEAKRSREENASELRIIRMEMQQANDRGANDRALIRIDLNQAMLQVQQRIDVGNIDRWTSSEMRKWVRDLKKDNPTISVPDTENK